MRPSLSTRADGAVDSRQDLSSLEGCGVSRRRPKVLLASYALRSIELLPLQLRGFVVAQPRTQAVRRDLLGVADVESAIVRNVKQDELRRGGLLDLAELADARRSSRGRRGSPGHRRWLSRRPCTRRRAA